MVGQLATDHAVTLAFPVPQRHPDRGEHQVGVLGARSVPGEDLLGEDIHDERDIHKPGPGPAVGEVGPAEGPMKRDTKETASRRARKRWCNL